MLSAGYAGAWSQEASHARAAVGGRTASDAVRPSKNKEGLALQKKKERANTTALWATLELLAPKVDENKGPAGHRSKALRGRAKEELLQDVMHAVRLARRLMGPDASGQACTTQAMAPGALQQAYTTQAGAGLIAIELKSGNIAYQSPSFQDLMGWIPAEARGNIRVSLESRDGDDFHSFCQSAAKGAGEPASPYGETYLNNDKVVGRSITVRFLTRAPGPPGLRNPEWLLMVRAVKLTLAGVQPPQLAGETPAAGRAMTFFGQRRIPEAIGVFTADLSGGTPPQWTLQVAHVRYLLDMEVASGTYEMDIGNLKPFEQMAKLYSVEFSKEGEVGASVFSRAATSALNIANRSFSWLTSKALSYTQQWVVRINDDDTVSISGVAHLTLFGGLSTSTSTAFVGGKVGVSHGGLDAVYLVADPRQPLDSNVRATSIRIASGKERGAFDVQHPFVACLTWGGGTFHVFCKLVSFDFLGKVVSSVEDVSQLFEKLKVSPGVGLLADGAVTFCFGKSDDQSLGKSDAQPDNVTCSPTDNLMGSSTDEHSKSPDDW